MPVARGKLCEASDRTFGFIRRDHHQIGQLINHDQQERQFLSAFRFHARIVIGDVARADFGELVITFIHFTRHPLQHAHHAFHLDHHRRKQMRNAVVTRQFHALGIHQHQAQIVRRVIQQKTGKDRVHAHRLARTGCACDQHMRHRFQIGGDGMSGHILSKCETQQRFISLEGFILQNIAQSNQRHLLVWNFDADIAVSRNGRLNADARRSQRQCEIIGERCDLADAHARSSASRLDEERLDAKLRDRRPAADLNYLCRRCRRMPMFLQSNVRVD